MGLIGNSVRLSASLPMRVLGAPLAGVTNRSNWNGAGASRNLWAGDAALSRLQGVPSGHRHPSAWVMAPTAGGLTSRGEISGVGEVDAANLAGGLNAEASLSGSGDLTAAMGLVMQAVATLSGLGGLSADVVGQLSAVATLAGSGDLTATLGALAGAVATLSGSGSLTGSPQAVGSISADITSEGELLTTGNVGAAVWNALASALGDAGTMGELLIGAGGGSSPSLVADAVWSHATATTLDARVLLVSKILRNRTETNPATGVMTVYDDDGTTPLLTANLYEDVAGATPYDGTNGSNRRNRLA